MIRLAQFLVLQALRHLGMTLAHPKRGRIPAHKSLSFCSYEYPGSGLLRLGIISITNSMGPTQLGHVV